MLMGNNIDCQLLNHMSDASDFSYFFTTKVSTIRNSVCPEDTPVLMTPLDDDVQVTLDSFAPESCNLDPIPTWLLKS